jgi:hypothetical protein
MKTLQFKTNINCGGCLRGVTPALDKHEDIRDWKVDLQSDDRILTVTGEDELTATEVQRTVSSAGFQAQPIKGS